MSKLGMGLTLRCLGSTEKSVEAWTKSKGKTIVFLEVADNNLIFGFEDGSRMAISDEGQDCCEYRWMHTDDNLGALIGASLDDIDVQEGPESTEEYGYKESAFLIVTTSKGQFTIVNYNEHNGHYGGFWIQARMLS